MKRVGGMKAGLCALACIGLLGMSAAAQAQDSVLPGAKRVIIGIDLSRSNPLVKDRAFAKRVARRVSHLVGNLIYSSDVHVRTFGSYDTASNSAALDVVLANRQNRTPRFIAKYIENMISATPRMVESGKWQAQRTTNIIAFVDMVTRSIGCSRKPTTIVLLTDGLEDSEYARLAEKDSRLPSPGRGKYRACAELQILGLGQGVRSPAVTARLRSEWSHWAHIGGFGHFVGLNDW